MAFFEIGVVAAAILAAAGVGGGIGGWFGHFFDKRDLTHVPTLLHFHGSNLTAAHVRITIGKILLRCLKNADLCLYPN